MPPKRDITFHYTPEDLAKELIKLVDIQPDDVLFEPFCGNGAFYNNFPQENKKEWCEIDKGRDIKNYEGVCDVIITNPPYKTDEGGGTFYMSWCFTKARKSCAFLLSIKAFNSLTPLRLKTWSDEGWNITKMHTVNVSKWYGRCYFVIFEKNKPSIITFDTGKY
jgi:hypothetical protein